MTQLRLVYPLLPVGQADRLNICLILLGEPRKRPFLYRNSRTTEDSCSCLMTVIFGILLIASLIAAFRQSSMLLSIISTMVVLEEDARCDDVTLGFVTQIKNK